VVSASGDTDDVRLEFDGDDLWAFEPGDIESIYTLDYLQRIVRAVPRDVEVTLRFVDTGAAERPLALRHSVMDGDGTGRWLLAPRVKR
jgi:proliferating cell nuclear antigen